MFSKSFFSKVMHFFKIFMCVTTTIFSIYFFMKCYSFKFSLEYFCLLFIFLLFIFELIKENISRYFKINIKLNLIYPEMPIILFYIFILIMKFYFNWQMKSSYFIVATILSISFFLLFVWGVVLWFIKKKYGITTSCEE